MAFFKRGRQPKMTTQALLDFDMSEGSSDSDFRIEDHNNSDDDCSDASKDDDDQDDDGGSSGSTSEDNAESDNASDNSTARLKNLLAADVDSVTAPGGGGGGGNGEPEDLEAVLRQLDGSIEKKTTKPICCVCLGDRSDDSNEVVECDGCGVSVHEGCYGVSDTASISSTNSTCSTEPWFCEACRAGVSEPTCELCPNKGGIFKETDVGKWVHLVCALYIPGVAFGEVDQLSSVTLFEMQYTKWGAKACSLCEDSRFARTGVCIGCDAGMCKAYFHVTCAQAQGFLIEAHHEEPDSADPFYAHCKVHSEKELIKKRKRNYNALRLNMQQKEKEKQAQRHEDPCPAQVRIKRKLLKYQRKYLANKSNKPKPWVPTQKMSRLLTTSASVVRRMAKKAEVMSVDLDLTERQEAQIASLKDIRKKWHVAPAFNVEFVAYYYDRISRTKDLNQQIGEMMEASKDLAEQQTELRQEYEKQHQKNRDLKTKKDSLTSTIELLHQHINALTPNKNLPNPANIGRIPAEPTKPTTPPVRPISVPTAAALKQGVGFPLAHLGPPGTKVDSTRLLSTHAQNSPTFVSCAISNTSTPTTSIAGCGVGGGGPLLDCGICKRMNDQHLLAKCDTCKLHYHLGCLNPPLTRHPKKSKLYGWQCSECDRSDGSEPSPDVPKGPRKSRTRFNRDGSILSIEHLSNTFPETCSNASRSGDNDGGAGIGGFRRKRVASLDSPFIYKKFKKYDRKPNGATESPNESILPSTKNHKNNQQQPQQQQQQQLLQQEEDDEDPEQLTKILTKKAKASALHRKTHAAEDLNVTPPAKPIPITSAASYEPLVVIDEPNESSRETDIAKEESADPLAIPVNSMEDEITKSAAATKAAINKQARKQKRKEKHKNKHYLSTDVEKSPNKEHKRKRKKKTHNDIGNTRQHGGKASAGGGGDAGDGLPKIKIKIKSIPLPGEVTPEARFFYVSADAVRSAEETSRASSVDTNCGDNGNGQALDEVSSQSKSFTSPVPIIGPSTSAASVAEAIPPLLNSRKSSPRKIIPRKPMGRPRAFSMAIPVKTFICSVCQITGTSSNVVTCDVCTNNYHFACLDPPLRKTPKIRGYSWHCAECASSD